MFQLENKEICAWNNKTQKEYSKLYKLVWTALYIFECIIDLQNLFSSSWSTSSYQVEREYTGSCHPIFLCAGVRVEVWRHICTASLPVPRIEMLQQPWCGVLLCMMRISHLWKCWHLRLEPTRCTWWLSLPQGWRPYGQTGRLRRAPPGKGWEEKWNLTSPSGEGQEIGELGNQEILCRIL